MPAGLTRKEFAISLLVAFGAAALGSCVMHRVLKPDMQEPNVVDYVKGRRAAIQAVQQEAEQRRSGDREKGVGNA